MSTCFCSHPGADVRPSETRLVSSLLELEEYLTAQALLIHNSGDVSFSINFVSDVSPKTLVKNSNKNPHIISNKLKNIENKYNMESILLLKSD